MKDKMENFDVMGALASIPSLKGEISKTEFALFMLHHIGKINEDDLGEIMHHFDLLDERKVGMIRIDSSTAMAMNSAVSSSNPMSQEEQLSEVDDEALLGTTTELTIVGKAEV
uniref:Uncharacterized protein n=1 Tax=Octactis speculum TaxID=3111310 RepID=A0A7S2MIU4_9STRA|mmetsp:Transcript_63284/g.87022  ORF Transcript_63284/g.87022 Transcript_63284/m.87022 type:complete len:113 (+) Transcript_63284:1124-1462(+)|eukprot:CAMPEP_0185751790 /NCGR_PEP_ID=MMETSP1174-20130828/10574_1 /TAXON_ID=35687 /ORGANISM="Dictyocha speculum, Strain CCMP1381" /LENGTH=112 /DNA_ID=CAMNT_0028428935 /DNA_START=976 /DNA_END=1314 /DNA_ORIENTATION=-